MRGEKRVLGSVERPTNTEIAFRGSPDAALQRAPSREGGRRQSDVRRRALAVSLVV